MLFSCRIRSSSACLLNIAFNCDFSAINNSTSFCRRLKMQNKMLHIDPDFQVLANEKFD